VLVDDDPGVLLVSQLALERLRVLGRPLRLLLAESGEAARRLLANEAEVALVVTDAVMETVRAGLDLLAWIRQQPHLDDARLVLRTGQPGDAPEQVVMESYDIQDYWPKTELTAHRMCTLVTGLIRSYRDLVTLRAQRTAVRGVLDHIGQLMSRDGVRALLESLLGMVQRTVGSDTAALAFLDLAADAPVQDGVLLLGTGPFAAAPGTTAAAVLPARARALLERSRERTDLVVDSDLAGLLCEFSGGRAVALVVGSLDPLDEWARTSLVLLARNALALVHNQVLAEERARLARSARRFVPDGLVRWIGRDDLAELDFADHRPTDAWVLFCDLRGFTRQAEARTPSETHAILLAFFGQVVPTVEAAGGTVDKFLGDGLMALFPPGPPPVDCARAIVESVRGQPPFPGADVGVGLHGGPVLLCTLGHAGRLDVTAVSDVVNVASRLEAMTRVLDCGVVASAEVAAAMGAGGPAVRPLGLLPIRGRSTRMPLVQILTRQEERAAAPAAALVAALAAAESGDIGPLAALEAAHPADRTLRVLRRVHADGAGWAR
jgi:class 3 adenylate cyclase